MLYALPQLTFTCSFFYHATTFPEFKKVNVYYIILTVSFGCEMLSKALWLETLSFLFSKLKFIYKLAVPVTAALLPTYEQLTYRTLSHHENIPLMRCNLRTINSSLQTLCKFCDLYDLYGL